MRNRAGATDVLLLGAVLMWAFNFPVTKYVLTNGFEPLAYAAVRYGVATALFAALTIAVERSLAVRGAASWRFLGLAVIAILLNQICFVYALELTSAATAALILGTTPVFTVLISYLIGVERITARTALAAAVSFGGVALVAAGSGGDLSGDLGGNLLAVGMAITWAAYSVAIAPLMRDYSPYRISAVVLIAMWVPLFAISATQVTEPGLLRARLGRVARARLCDRRAARADERALVHGDRTRRPVPCGDLREPPSLRRSHPRRPLPRRDADADPDSGWRPDRAGHPRRAPPRARRSGRLAVALESGS